MNAVRSLAILAGIWLVNFAPAQATIILQYSQADVGTSAYAYGDGPTHDDDRDTQSGFTSYTNSLNAAVNNSWSQQQSDGSYITYNSSGSGSASATASADVGSGLFEASGSHSGSGSGLSSGYWNGGGFAFVDFRFDVDQAYAYRLEAEGSSGTALSFQFWGDFQDPSDTIYFSSTNAGLQIVQEGTFLPWNIPNQRNGIYAGIQGCEFGCSGGADGSFSFRLTLTPLAVPQPAALWLLVPGLAGLGLKRRRRIT